MIQCINLLSDMGYSTQWNLLVYVSVENKPEFYVSLNMNSLLNYGFFPSQYCGCSWAFSFYRCTQLVLVVETQMCALRLSFIFTIMFCCVPVRPSQILNHIVQLSYRPWQSCFCINFLTKICTTEGSSCGSYQGCRAELKGSWRGIYRIRIDPQFVKRDWREPRFNIFTFSVLAHACMVCFVLPWSF
jgi:hypothetical protein